MKRAKPIAKHFMFAFEGKLNRLDSDECQEVSGDLEDVYIWDEDPLTYKMLPPEIPEVVRRKIIALNKQQLAIGNEIEAMLEQLNTTAVRIAERKEREEEKSKPHCDKCGQVVPPKTKKRR